jgi:hypothetical protein
MIAIMVYLMQDPIFVLIVVWTEQMRFYCLFLLICDLKFNIYYEWSF